MLCAAMSDYCVIPPYVARGGVMPNISVVYEKGASIEIGAYYGNAYDSTKTYYGFFKPTANYTYNTANNYFEQPSPACTPTGSNNCFSGNILNYALMSSLDLSRKALVGFGWPNLGAGTSAGDVFTYSGNFCNNGNWTSDGTICSTQTLTPISYGSLSDGNSKCIAVNNVNIGGIIYSYAFKVDKYTGSNPTNLSGIQVQPGIIAPSCPNSCIAPCTQIISPGNSGQVAMKFTDEPRTGIIQKYADKDSNYQYDTDAPRFGVKRWQSGAGGKQEDIIRDSPALTSAERATFYRNLISAISRAPGSDSGETSASNTPYLGGMMKEIENYYKGSSSAYEDSDSLSQTPYSWSTDPLKACRKTFALYVTTGTYLGQDTDKLSPLPSPACSSLTYTDAFPTNTCFAYNTDLYSADGSPPKQNISTYVVHTTFYGSGAANEAKLTYAANVSDGEYLKVDDPNKFQEVLDQAILDMLKRTASGTAASVLASGQGSGANLVQAVFYPKTPKLPLGIYEKRVEWIGRLTNFWYYVDPRFSTSTILADTTSDNVLDLSNDKTVTLRYDRNLEKTVGDLYTYGSTTPSSTGIAFESLKYLWEAGTKLWSRDVTTGSLTRDKRKIYTFISGTSFLSGNFSADSNNGDSDNSATLLSYFALPTADSDGDGFKDGDLNHDGAVDSNDASVLIRYVHGEDFLSRPWMRSRTTAIDLNGNGVATDPGESANVWKLGDILNSTPRISSWIQLNNYDTVYLDKTYSNYINDLNDNGTPKATPVYTNRGMVFTGGNDGMLHAFKLGKLELSWTGQTKPPQYARMTDTTNMGKEIWSFIPKNALPYLKYMADPNYCHVYSVDLSPYIFDASINDDAAIGASPNGTPDHAKTVDSWRTILIGGMRFGGACKNSSTACTTDLNDDHLVNDKDCVKTPVANVGYSSYFALDITDQNNPIFLWEFAPTDANGNSILGYATTGPTIVRISARDNNGTPDKDKNGHWFVVFGSGPTGPVTRSPEYQFLGRSDQNLQIFVLDLLTGIRVATPFDDTGITNAFAGSMINGTLDSDVNYQDDVVYIPYVKRGNGTWNEGGVLRLLTKEDPVPSHWAWGDVMDQGGTNIGPVTSSVVRLLNKDKGILWLYFGTGRYYFELANNVDDPTTQRRLFGIKDPCFFPHTGFNLSCTSTVSVSSSSCPVSGSVCSVTNISSVPTETVANGSSFKGWYIDLDANGIATYNESGTNVTRDYRAERVITDPLSTTSGMVFFTTFKPYNDICAYGGKSFIWSVRYNTGGAPGALLKGLALLQVSTGAVEQVNLSTAFTAAGGRKSVALEGVPPVQQGLSLLSTPPPLKKTIHIRER